MRFGPFEIERPLGRGGMAETFVARYRTAQGFERTVCVKRILAEHAASPAFVSAFQEEAKLAMQLVHPHITQVYDFGEVDGAWWMSLELIGGGDLRTFLKELGQPMPLDLALVLAVDLAAALDYAHELVVDGRAANLVHRDVSPSNVLIDEQGNFKLVDFGIAKWSLSGSDTTTGKIKGKASYMAPEQGLGRKVDRRADLWALGVVLFEALSGQRPFDAPSDLATILRITQGERATLKELAPHVPDDVCTIVEKLLTVDLDARTASASAVIEALEHRPPPTTARRRLAQLLKRIQSGEARSDLPPPPQGDARTLAITSLALGATEDDPVAAPADAETRTRTVFDADLARSVNQGAFEPTQRHASVAPRAPSDGATKDATANAGGTSVAATSAGGTVDGGASNVVVSPELTPQRLEITETRPAFSRASLPLLLLGVASVGLAVGALVAFGFVLGAGSSDDDDPSDVIAITAPDAALSDAPMVVDAGVDAGRDAAVDVVDAGVDAGTELDAYVGPDAFVARASESAAEETTSSTETPTRAPREGRVEVIVSPWGRVEIDGVDVGRSPYRGALGTGPHTIVGVAGDQRRSRAVRVTGRGVTRVSIAIE